MTLLNILYDQLDFKSGGLYTATDKPLSGQMALTGWKKVSGFQQQNGLARKRYFLLKIIL